MMARRHAFGVLAFLVIACRAVPRGAEGVVTRAAEQSARSEGLGHVVFPNSGPERAQELFLRGVLLLHSFEYPDAAEAFRGAQELAPDFALAYWGEALAHCHPIWQEEDREAAQLVLARLAPTPAERATKAGDEREGALLASVEVLFGEGTRAERARLYCDALALLQARYPNDLELAAFHALAILGTATQGRDVPTYMRAAAVAEEVLERAPDHPGALHYAIHSYDDPTHAPLGLRMARRYGVVAAAAEHALHMPSHIYVALGMWEDSVAANVAAAAAADARRARKGLEVDARGFHSLVWLAYSHLQLGNTGAAERLLADMRRDEREKSTRRTRASLVSMRSAHVVALQTWEGELARFEVALDDLEPDTACAELYVRGRAALARGEIERARAALAMMAEHRGPLETLDPAAGTAAQCCTTGRTNYLPSRLAAQVMELELSGLIALQAGAQEDALARLAGAAEKEDALGDDFGPPAVVEPAHELLGQVLHDLGRPAEAAREFEAALERAPGRARSLYGLAAAGARAVP